MLDYQYTVRIKVWLNGAVNNNSSFFYEIVGGIVIIYSLNLRTTKQLF